MIAYKDCNPKWNSWTMAKKRYSKSVAAKTSNHCWYCGLLLFPVSMIKEEKYIEKYIEIYPDIKKGEAKKHLKFTHDHIIPRSLGGGNKRGNLVLACNYCNSHRQSTTVEDFRKWVFNDCIDVCGQMRMPFKKIPRLWIKTENSVIFYGEQISAGVA